MLNKPYARRWTDASRSETERTDDIGHPPSGGRATGPDGELPPTPAGHVRLTIDGVVGRCAEGRTGHPDRRADRHRHPAVLRPSAARAGRRLPAVSGRGGDGRPADAEAAGVLHPDGRRRHGGQDPGQLAGGEKAQRSNLEFLLLNHPLDCPICDKGGECPLQNQTLANGSAESRMHEAKRVFTKPIAISTEILLDRERCVLCQRCTRFSEQIAGDQFIDLLERGSKQQIGINSRSAVPVVLLGQHHPDLPGRRADLGRLPVPVPARSTWCRRQPCASTAPPAASMRTDHRSAGSHAAAGRQPIRTVNEEWNCDKGRFAFAYAAGR